MPHHIDAKKIILNELMGKASNTYGSTDQLIINKKMMYNLKLKQWNISAACIHYKKAFDSVPHGWIIEILKIHKSDPTTKTFLRKTMNNWKTSLHFNHQDSQIKIDHFSINIGIFQGDSPSGLLFILPLLPLSWLLNTRNIGYRIKPQCDVISYLLFMGDFKLYAANDNQLASMIKIVSKFSDDIEMNFGIDKCEKFAIQRGKIVHMENIQLGNGEN